MTRRELLGAAVLAGLFPRFVLAGDEVILDSDEYKGVKASAPISKGNRKQNAGGSDRQGLCVVATCVAILYEAGERALGDWIWAEARRAAGGYYPEKLHRLFLRAQAEFPASKFQWRFETNLDRWEQFARDWTLRGYTVGITYSRAERYPFGIDHMVALEHIGKNDAYGCVMDNNFVERDERGPRSWMGLAELRARVTGRGGPWVVAIKTRNHPRQKTPKPKPQPRPAPTPDPMNDATVLADRVGVFLGTIAAACSCLFWTVKGVRSFMEQKS